MQINSNFRTQQAFLGKRTTVDKNSNEELKKGEKSEANLSKDRTVTMSLDKFVQLSEQYASVQPENNESNKTESGKFNDIYAEFQAKVPDQTSTIEEKELALEYIDKMLACDDIPDDAKKFWTYNKTVIQAEIIAIKNENPPKNESYKDVMKALDEFANDYMSSMPEEFLTVKDRLNYVNRYNYTCISFYERALKSNNISAEEKRYCLDQINYHRRDLNNGKTDLNNYNRENGLKTELFNDVYNEFIQIVPDSTSTLSEKELAISYIDRMLSCDDIPNHLQIYWQNKKDIIAAEIEKIKR